MGRGEVREEVGGEGIHGRWERVGMAGEEELWCSSIGEDDDGSTLTG